MNDGAGQQTATRISLSDDDVRVLSDKESFDDGHITVLKRPYRLIKPVGRGYKGVVWRVKDEYGVDFALKIAVGEDYEDRSFHKELRLRAKLVGPAFTRCLGADFWTTPAIPDRRFVVTVEDWVEGITLEEFIADPEELTTEVLQQFGRGITGALRSLQANGLVHDDLRPANVMFRRASEGEAMQYGIQETEMWNVVVVDTGSLKEASKATKDRDDIRWAAEHLVSIHNQLRRRRHLTQTQLRYLRSVLDVVEQLLDSEARGLRSADQLHRQLEEAYSRSLVLPPREPELQNPFDFLSAERIADDELLIQLFTDVPWMGQVSGPDPILLTGPRGCGKSMLFRWLSLRTHLANRREIPDGANDITGVYISCTTELQNRFLDLDSPELAAAHRTDIVHYFNLLLARELLVTLDHIARHETMSRVYSIGLGEQRDIMEFVLRRVTPTSTNLVGTSPLRIAISAIEREMFGCHRRLMRREPSSETTGTAFLGEFTDMLTTSIPVLRSRPIVFLLDDFSTHRVPEHVQRILGPIVWERRSSHVFKISSEKNGVIFDYQKGAVTADASRERVEIDCGKEYIDLSNRTSQARTAAERFAHDLLARRLELAGWQGTPQQLIGESPRYAEWVADLQRSDKTPLYYGMTMISELCSGDIATLLMIYRRILSQCSKDQITTVSAPDQNRAIQQVSNEVLANLVPQRPHGPRMHQLASAFSHFVGQAVIKGRPIDGKPRECPRIEVDQGAESKTDLAKELQELLDELVRRSVFIELDPSRSRRGHVSTLRLHIRRIYMPAARGPLHKNDAVKFTPSRFEEFLTDPQAALATVMTNISDDDGDDLQDSLFD